MSFLLFEFSSDKPITFDMIDIATKIVFTTKHNPHSLNSFDICHKSSNLNTLSLNVNINIAIVSHVITVTATIILGKTFLSLPNVEKLKNVVKINKIM